MEAFTHKTNICDRQYIRRRQAAAAKSAAKKQSEGGSVGAAAAAATAGAAAGAAAAAAVTVTAAAGDSNLTGDSKNSNVTALVGGTIIRTPLIHSFQPPQ